MTSIKTYMPEEVLFEDLKVGDVFVLKDSAAHLLLKTEHWETGGRHPNSAAIGKKQSYELLSSAVCYKVVEITYKL